MHPVGCLGKSAVGASLGQIIAHNGFVYNGCGSYSYHFTIGTPRFLFAVISVLRDISMSLARFLTSSLTQALATGFLIRLP